MGTEKRIKTILPYNTPSITKVVISKIAVIENKSAIEYNSHILKIENLPNIINSSNKSVTFESYYIALYRHYCYNMMILNNHNSKYGLAPFYYEFTNDTLNKVKEKYNDFKDKVKISAEKKEDLIIYPEAFCVELKNKKYYLKGIYTSMNTFETKDKKIKFNPHFEINEKDGKLDITINVCLTFE